MVLHAVIWHPHLSPLPPVRTRRISSLIKAPRRDAFNINHIQRAVRTQPSACQPESAHASGAGYALLRSIISLKIKSPREPWPPVAPPDCVAPFLLPRFCCTEPLKLGLETFVSATFFAAMVFLEDRRELPTRADSLWILIGNSV